MKSLITLIVVGVLIAVAFVVTKPTDQQCIDLMKSKMQTEIAASTNKQFFAVLINYAVNVGFNTMQGGFKFQDNLFYKDVYFGSAKVGSAYFGTFSIDRNFENAIAEMREKAEEKKRRRVEAVKSLFRVNNKVVREVGSDIQAVDQQLEDAYVKLRKLRRFHVLRTKGEKEQQVSSQEQYIQQLEERKRLLQGR